MKTRITIQTEQTGKSNIQNIMKRLAKITGSSVSAGFFKESSYTRKSGDIPVASVAMWNNNGMGNNPERPFFTKGILIGQMSARGLSEELLGDVVLGNMTTRAYLNAIGTTYQDAIVQAIDSDMPPPNESRYWERKMLKGLKKSGKNKFKKRKAEGADYLDILKEMDEKYTSGKSEGKFKYQSAGGGNPKTLINTGIMRKAVSYRVDS